MKMAIPPLVLCVHIISGHENKINKTIISIKVSICPKTNIIYLPQSSIIIYPRQNKYWASLGIKSKPVSTQITGKIHKTIN